VTDEITNESLTENNSHSPNATQEIPDRSLSENPSQSLLKTDEISAQGIRDHGHPLPKARSPKRIALALLGLALLVTLGFLGFHALVKPNTGSGSGSGRSKDRGSQVIPVTVAKVTQKTVPVQLQAIGNVQAESTVSVTPQVAGQITGIFFQKGQDVKKGQLLFTLDEQTQLAAIQQARGILAKDQAQVQQARATLARDQGLVRQAEATLAKDQAQAEYAQAQSTRYNNLYKQGAVSQDQAQQYSTNSRVSAATLQADKEAIANAQAVVQGDQAAIENAQAVLSGDLGALKNVEVQLSYTKVYAPIDGRAGDILVQQGNVLQANNSTNPLVKIAKIHPIQVSFSVPETNLPTIQKYMHNKKLLVEVSLPNSQAHPIQGVLTFVNNTVDNSTGTIQLMGEFDNFDAQLWPGQFVNATLTLTKEPNAIVVPSQAVQNGPNGQFVFVVKPNMTVENVPVTISSTVDELSVVQKGLQPGDTVVTDGQANLISGSKVQLKPTANSSPAGTPRTGGKRQRSKEG